MKGLDENERRALNAAEGWLILKCPAEAERELQAIRTEHLGDPEVLYVRWAVNFRWKRWEEACTVSRLWCQTTPELLEAWIALANSTRESMGLEQAKQVLVEISQRFSRHWVVPYNLACYCAQLGEIAEAVLWLNKALSMDPCQKVRREAAGDPDLAPLWKALAKAALEEEICSTAD
ncbi:MAG: hypothetical protein L0Z50_24350 [Verrucomicrobiales bacterium]|nr:hypothetical protein [Verrucomicrobiales bacterium]